jgi:hypothetical protein
MMHREAKRQQKKRVPYIMIMFKIGIGNISDKKSNHYSKRR